MTLTSERKWSERRATVAYNSLAGYVAVYGMETTMSTGLTVRFVWIIEPVVKLDIPIAHQFPDFYLAA